MSGLDEGRTGSGEPEAGPAPFYPGPAGRRGTVPPPGTPLPAPPAAPASGAAAGGAGAVPMTLRGTPSDITTGVEGRITIEDEVIAKIAGLAALEVAGVAALLPRPGPGPVRPGPAGTGRAAAGVAPAPDRGGGAAGDPGGDKAGDRPGDSRGGMDADEVTLDVAIAVEYGSVIRDVADAVKANVARVAGVMLGARVAAVNVSVGDVRKPAGPQR
ncbi:Asp23/Gls24 family envelope stress response protein [Actinomadura welshii]